MRDTDEQLLDDRYDCSTCDVTFRERYPRFYDVTPCPYCRDDAHNVALTAHRAAGAPRFW